MKITVNGESHEFEDGMTVLALLDALNLTPAATVVEQNGDILKRDTYAGTAINEGDVLELVRFVGGG